MIGNTTMAFAKEVNPAVRKKHWLLLAVAALSWFNAGAIWLIQFSCYPLWPYVGQSEFSNYHGVWLQSTWGVVFVPSVLALAGSILLLKAPPLEVSRGSLWVGLSVQVAIQLVTVIWLWPLERSMVAPTGGLNLSAYEELLLTNWLRIVLNTAYAVLTYWMLSRSLWRGMSRTGSVAVARDVSPRAVRRRQCLARAVGVLSAMAGRRTARSV